MNIIEVKDLNKDVRIGVVVGRFHKDIVDELLDGTLSRLKELEVNPDNVTVAYVPGAIEIPLTAKQLAATGKYDAIIAIGAVIRGETSHYDYVCQQVSYGCQQVMLELNVPVIFGVLTTETIEQAQARTDGEKSYRGREFADSAFEMISVLEQI